MLASDPSEVRAAIDGIKRNGEGFLTNFFLDSPMVAKLISGGKLGYRIAGKSLFLFRQNDTFFNLYFCSTSVESLATDIANVDTQFKGSLLIVDVVGFLSEVSKITEALVRVGFYKYVSLVRMSGNSHLNINAEDDGAIIYADARRGREVFSLLQRHFDPYAEQIPDLEEVEELASQNRILLNISDDRIQGFLIFVIEGRTSHLRYWFVLPECRGSLVGSLLFRRYMYECRHTRRQLLWVRQANDNAIVRYEHYGYKRETLVDQILSNGDISYEKENS
jgi:hypothetical protein